MANGPLSSYVAPSVITRTEIKGNLTAPPAGIQIPVFIGVGQESLTLTNHEMVRGSSSSVDLKINKEDASLAFIHPVDGGGKGVDGNLNKFRVAHFPIVTGTGQGRATNNPQHVQVTVDGIDVVVAAVRGSEGEVTLQVPPPAGSKVEVTYHFSRTDTLREDDVSGQVDPARASLTSPKAGDFDIDATNKEVILTVDGGKALRFDLAEGLARTASAIVGDITANAGNTSLTASVQVDNTGAEYVVIEADASLQVGPGTANGVFGFYEGQRTRRTRTFFTHFGPIVVGDNGGRTTADPSDLKVRVNGALVAVQQVDGSDRAVTLKEAPPVGATVKIEYYHNTWQDTYDYLPNIDIRRVVSVGFAPGRNDYIEGFDFVVDREAGEIHWGSSWTVTPGLFTSSGTNAPFDKGMFKVSLKDDRVYNEEVPLWVDTSLVPPRPSDRVVVLGRTPVSGEDRGNKTSDPQTVDVKVGMNLGDAKSVAVTKVDPETRRVTLKDPVPAGHKVFATYHYSRLGDYSFTVTKTSGNTLEVSSPQLNDGAKLFNAKFGSNSAGQTINFPSGNQNRPDAFIAGPNGVNETVTVTFGPVGTAAPAVFTFPNKGPFDLYQGVSDTLDIAIDGQSTPQSFTLPANTAAAVTGTTLTDLQDLKDNITGATFSVKVNGQVVDVDLSGLTLQGGAVNLAADIALVSGKINTDLGSLAAATDNGTEITITSGVTPGSKVEILGGTANQYIGFTEGDVAVEGRVTLQDIEGALNGLTGATAAINGNGYLEVTTSLTGSSASIEFPSGTALLPGTGLGIKAGDSAQGTGQDDGFTVTSTHANGSGTGSTSTGVIGQTYVDGKTGLTFTVMEADSAPYSGSFTLIVEDDQEMGSGVVNQSVPGIWFHVTGTEDVADGDTAALTTYNKSGQEPGIGDYYYITYEYGKTDYSPKLFSKFSDIEQHFGTLGPNNPITLACYLAMQNGASIIAVKQVEKTPGLQVAPSNSYIRALDELKKPLEGGVRPNLIIPLTSDPAVMAATTLHCETQSSPRNRNECRALFGVASGTRPLDAAALAKGLNSDRAMVLYPDAALLTLTDPLGNDATYIVDGTALAAALAGVVVSPSNDVATPLTKRTIAGFDRLNRTMEDVEKDMLATAGVTVLQERAPLIEVRHALTTNLDNRLTSTPSVVAIRDFVQQQCRKTLDRFIGLKFLSSRAQDVELAMTGMLKSLVESQIIAAYAGVTAEPDPGDPTIMRVSAYYAPIFPLLYIDVHFVITANSV